MKYWHGSMNIREEYTYEKKDINYSNFIKHNGSVYI